MVVLDKLKIPLEYRRNRRNPGRRDLKASDTVLGRAGNVYGAAAATLHAGN